MSQYIDFVADRLLVALGNKKYVLSSLLPARRIVHSATAMPRKSRASRLDDALDVRTLTGLGVTALSLGLVWC